MAQAQGITHLGIVDHDTTTGLAQAINNGREYGVEIITGVEISAFDSVRNKRVHILGYNFTAAATHIQALCAPLLARRTANSLRYVATLLNSGYEITPAEVKAKAAASAAIYKQHIMQVLVEKGIAETIYSSLYYRHFKHGGICSQEIEYLDAFAAIAAIKSDGGMAVLAHPGQLGSFELLEDLVDAGPSFDRSP